MSATRTVLIVLTIGMGFACGEASSTSWDGGSLDARDAHGDSAADLANGEVASGDARNGCYGICDGTCTGRCSVRCNETLPDGRCASRCTGVCDGECSGACQPVPRSCMDPAGMTVPHGGICPSTGGPCDNGKCIPGTGSCPNPSGTPGVVPEGQLCPRGGTCRRGKCCNGCWDVSDSSCVAPEAQTYACGTGGAECKAPGNRCITGDAPNNPCRTQFGPPYTTVERPVCSGGQERWCCVDSCSISPSACARIDGATACSSSQRCSGICFGTCAGTCDHTLSDGRCAGACVGSCAGLCRGSCT